MTIFKLTYVIYTNKDINQSRDSIINTKATLKVHIKFKLDFFLSMNMLSYYSVLQNNDKIRMLKI